MSLESLTLSYNGECPGGLRFGFPAAPAVPNPVRGNRGYDQEARDVALPTSGKRVADSVLQKMDI